MKFKKRLRFEPFQKKRNGSVFRKILIIFFAITIIMFSGSLWFYSQAYHTMSQNLNELMSSSISSNMALLDEQIQTLINWGQSLCVNSDAIKQLSEIPQALSGDEKSTMINELRSKFLELKLASGLVEDVWIHFSKSGMTISQHLAQASLDEDEYEYIDRHYTRSSPMIVYDGKPLLITNASYLFEVQQEEMIPYYLVIELSKDKILQNLVSNNHDSEIIGSAVYTEDGSLVIPEDVSALTTEIMAQEMEQPDADRFQYKSRNMHYLVYVEHSSVSSWVLIEYLSEQSVFRDLQGYRNWLLLFICAYAAALTLFSFMVYYNVHKPIHRLVDAYKRVESGDFDVAIDYRKIGEFSYLYKTFNWMVRRLKQLIEQVYEKTLLSQKAELSGLQSQINPHFFYNSMFLLSVSAQQGDLEFVQMFTDKLGRYFNFLYRSDEEGVALSEEMEHAMLYADIQAKRFINRVTIEAEPVPEAYQNLQVPRLIVQPLIENAFKHSLEKAMADGALRIAFQAGTDTLDIIVENNGDVISQEKLEQIRDMLTSTERNQTRSGISNIHRRLQIQFGMNSGLRIDAPAQGGLRVTIHIEAARPAPGDENEGSV